MITYFQATRLHSTLIEKSGGVPGIRDNDGLLSALYPPFQTFDEKELYPTTIEKAAALIESILQNHPF